MKKRVAVQFVGHLRSFKKTFKTFRANIIDQNEKCGISIDVFIHTWDELEHTDTPGHYKIDKSRVGKPLTDKDLKWVQNNYKPKSIMIGKQQALTTKETEIAAKHNIHGKVSKNMCLTFYQSNVLREKYEQEHCF
ncbi:MAG: hypothetical protein LBB34_04775, partial [Holosporales bacterium]|nr:hypothetical protein [Holosporales bacterium]